MIAAAKWRVPQVWHLWNWTHVFHHNELRIIKFVEERTLAFSSAVCNSGQRCSRGIMCGRSHLLEYDRTDCDQSLHSAVVLSCCQNMSTRNSNTVEKFGLDTSKKLKDMSLAKVSPPLSSNGSIDKVTILDLLKQECSTIDDNKVPAVVDVCVRHKLPITEIVQLILECPEIQASDLDDLNDCILSLLHGGLNAHGVTAIIKEFPNILKRLPGLVGSVMDCLQGLAFKESEAHHIISGYPAALSISTKEIQEKFFCIMSLFKRSDAVSLVLDSPCILSDSCSSIEARFHYVKQEMGLGRAAMLRSRMFNFSLQHIYMRHLFLCRAGMFEKPDKHGNTKMENPSLRRIVQDSDRNFACRTAGMMLVEYQAFKEMLREGDRDILGDSDEESDDSSDEEIDEDNI